MLETESDQISETAEASGTTGSSAGSSTPESTGSSSAPVEPVQALDIPPLRSSAYHEKKWEYEELKKLLPARMKKKVSRNFIALAKRARFTTEQVLEAESFFAKEFPLRSPWAVYQKAMEMKRAGKKRIVLL